MWETILQLDTDVFRWINGHYCVALDWLMWSVSQRWCWAIVIVFVLIPFIIDKQFAKQWWIILLGVAGCFLLADQGSVHLFKETVCRLRPCHALDDVRMFRTNCGGQYGFVSSHAANAFAIVTFLWMLCGKKRGRWWIRIALLVWALLTCYSRVYLGKHYPGDLLCGALFGVVVGLLVWGVVNFFVKKTKKVETK